MSSKKVISISNIINELELKLILKTIGEKVRKAEADREIDEMYEEYKRGNKAANIQRSIGK